MLAHVVFCLQGKLGQRMALAERGLIRSAGGLGLPGEEQRPVVRIRQRRGRRAGAARSDFNTWRLHFWTLGPWGGGQRPALRARLATSPQGLTPDTPTWLSQAPCTALMARWTMDTRIGDVWNKTLYLCQLVALLPGVINDLSNCCELWTPPDSAFLRQNVLGLTLLGAQGRAELPAPPVSGFASLLPLFSPFWGHPSRV